MALGKSFCSHDLVKNILKVNCTEMHHEAEEGESGGFLSGCREKCLV